MNAEYQALETAIRTEWPELYGFLYYRRYRRARRQEPAAAAPCLWMMPWLVRWGLLPAQEGYYRPPAVPTLPDVPDAETMVELREGAGLARSVVADWLCVHEARIAQWESGRLVPNAKVLPFVPNSPDGKVAMVLDGEPVGEDRTLPLRRLYGILAAYLTPDMPNPLAGSGLLRAPDSAIRRTWPPPGPRL